MSQKSKRLAWQCRRGMLELDLLLIAFFHDHYSHLKTEDQKLFEQLLTFQDAELYQWLVKGEKPDAVFEVIIRAIVCGH